MAFGEHQMAFMASLDGDEQTNHVARILDDIAKSLRDHTEQADKLHARLRTCDFLSDTLCEYMEANREVSLIVDGIGIHAGVIRQVEDGLVVLQHSTGYTSTFRIAAVQGVTEVVNEKQ